MSEWLDLELSHHLAPVAAPDALWSRIESRVGRTAQPPTVQPHMGRPIFKIAWPVAVAAGLLFLVTQYYQPALNLQQLAIEQLRTREPLAMHSSDPRAISAWMRQAGIDISLPARSSQSVHLLGARVLERRGARIGAVSYRVGSDTATLLIARAGMAAESAHGGLACKTRGQSYTVACSNLEHPEAACLLCHATL